ncbi:aminotransferase class III-fold pyridoxal phosphate-dependent enzyme [Brevibacterium litoralis]|uniref:aminotransferase class III-fold pyridoxal phosphate-dependent enzyme n=1 Tax=Brevibacterium litoralis TaxID=3138935 RepID=UPI0032EBA453
MNTPLDAPFPTATLPDTDDGAHLWRHFAPMADKPSRVIESAEGCYLTDTEGNRLLDGIANLFCVNIGYSFGEEIGQAAAAQMAKLPYHSTWGSSHPTAVALAEKVASLAPGDLDHVFFTPSGGESVETAIKIARQYFRLKGENRFKVVSRYNAYHGTSLGALSVIGIPAYRQPFEPLLPGMVKVRNTRRVDRPAGETEEEFTQFLLNDLEERIVQEGPETIALILQEPVQNHGGMLVPPKGYSTGVRAIADKYGILVAADETITGWGRTGHWFASERFDVQPDIITTAKGLSSAYAVIGCAIASEKVYAPFREAGVSFTHGNTFGGHPVMCAIALKNLEIMEREALNAHVLAKETELRDTIAGALEGSKVVTELRGTGFFLSVEFANTKADGSPMTQDELTKLYGKATLALFEDEGVMFRLGTGGGIPTLSICPPLVADTPEFEHMARALTAVVPKIEQMYFEL